MASELTSLTPTLSLQILPTHQVHVFFPTLHFQSSVQEPTETTAYRRPLLALLPPARLFAVNARHSVRPPELTNLCFTLLWCPPLSSSSSLTHASQPGGGQSLGCPLSTQVLSGPAKSISSKVTSSLSP